MQISSKCNLSIAMGARNYVGIGLSYRPASLCSLATQFQTRLIAGLKFPTQYSVSKYSWKSSFQNFCMKYKFELENYMFCLQGETVCSCGLAEVLSPQITNEVRKPIKFLKSENLRIW